jgi:hypothetical protein
MDPTKEQHQILCKSLEEWEGDPDNDQTSVWGRKYEPYIGVPMICPNSPRQVKCKVKSMLITFLDSKGIVHKELVLAG